MSAIEPYFLVDYLLNFAKHLGSTEHSLNNAEPRPKTIKSQVCLLFALLHTSHLPPGGTQALSTDFLVLPQ